ncbi:MAG: phage terminase large subunit [Hyphomicrobiaceae bacterium]
MTNLPTSPSPFQARVLAYRRHCNIFNGGGRGSGKSVSLCFDVLDHCKELGPAASVLVLRESHAGLQELMFKLYQLAVLIFGTGVGMNKAAGTLQLPSGALVTFSNVGDADSYAKIQGRTFTMLAADELGNYPMQAIHFVSLIRSNLRPPKGIRPHIHVTANPFGRAHTFCLKQYVNRGAPWEPYRENGDGDWWVNCHSNLEDNPHIDQEQYRRQLQAATTNNPALNQAWEFGDWAAKGGGLMFDMFEPTIHVRKPPRARMRYIVGGDFGTASPSTAILLGELRDHASHFVPGDIFAIDMIDTCLTRDDYATGDGSPPPFIAAMIRDMLTRNSASLNTEVIFDDMRGTFSETVVGIFRDHGLNAYKPTNKDRTGTWALMRTRLQAAANGDGRGLWISPKCGHLIDTIGIAPRDDLRPEDISRHFREDHAIDGCGYGLRELASGPRVSQGRVIGMW